MTVSMTIMTVYTLQRLHNFNHRLVISWLATRLKVSILPNVHFLWCTARRSPHSLSQCFPAYKMSALRFHRCGLVISWLATRLKVSILPNVDFLWCTARRSPHSLSQRFPAYKMSALRFHCCGLPHPTEAPSCAMVRSKLSITYGPDYTILSLCQQHPRSWENNMLLN
jgi:hypothetical protein